MSHIRFFVAVLTLAGCIGNVIAQVPVQVASTQAAHAIGICQIVDNTPGWPAGEVRNAINPVVSVQNYLFRSASIDLSNAKGAVVIDQPPKHGTVKVVEGNNRYEYLPPSPTYTGKDSAGFLVEIGSYIVRVRYVFHVLTNSVGERPEDIKEICYPKGAMWKIA